MIGSKLNLFPGRIRREKKIKEKDENEIKKLNISITLQMPDWPEGAFQKFTAAVVAWVVQGWPQICQNLKKDISQRILSNWFPNTYEV